MTSRKIARIETFLVPPRWLFVRVESDDGAFGWGDVTLPAEGFHSRLSDLLNREGVQFIALVDATISGRNGEPPVKREFIAVARDHIQIAYESTD